MLSQSILQTIIYFDLLEYPLTTVELWQYFWLSVPAGGHTITTSEFESEVRALVADGKIFEQNGFLFLPNRNEIVALRESRALIALKKYKRAIHFAKLLRYFPFVRMIAVTNTLALENSRKDSDIDLFFVIKSGRLWIARFFIISYFAFRRVRPAPGKMKDAICVCWFVSDEAMDLSPVLLENDINLHYWMASVEGVFESRIKNQESRSVYLNFWEANKVWLMMNLPNAQSAIAHPRRSVQDTWFSRWMRWKVEILFFGRWGNMWENILCKYQLGIMPQELKDLAAKGGTNVVMNGSMLKFHSTDRREEMREKWRIKNQEVRIKDKKTFLDS